MLRFRPYAVPLLTGALVACVVDTSGTSTGTGAERSDEVHRSDAADVPAFEDAAAETSAVDTVEDSAVDRDAEDAPSAEDLAGDPDVLTDSPDVGPDIAADIGPDLPVDVDVDVTPDAEPAVECAPIASHADWSLCSSDARTCSAVFDDGAGCTAVCAAAGLACLAVHENIDGSCAPDVARPALTCSPGSGHQSDYCVCGIAEECAPSCTGRICGPDGCGGTCGRCETGTCSVDGTGCETVERLCSPESCPAFPGAEGEGMFSRGGRGGDVCIVTSLSSSGSGTLRDCLSGSGARTVVFEVAGIIDLTAALQSSRSGLTIAGQTAPGDGVVIRGYQTQLSGDNMVVQHIRFRAGDIRKKTETREGFTEDSLTVSGNNIIVDHVSASWGIDESLSAGSRIDNLTVQYSIIAEGLHRTRLFHGEYDADHAGHSMGSLFKPSEGDVEMSIHHNLYAHNNNRNPAIGAYSRSQEVRADIRNNVIYDCPNTSYTSGEAERTEVNLVGNYNLFGPESREDALFEPDELLDVRIWQTGNRRDLDRNRTLTGRDDGWSMIEGEYSRASSEFTFLEVTTQTADAAFAKVLAEAGARPWSRDDPDERIIRSVTERTGGVIDSQDEVGGWGGLAAGSAPADTDRDGMPDDWERSAGTDPRSADNNGDRNGDGYTNLENYLHYASRLTR